MRTAKTIDSFDSNGSDQHFALILHSLGCWCWGSAIQSWFFGESGSIQDGLSPGPFDELTGSTEGGRGD